MAERTWVTISREPCPYCEVWIGPHRHAFAEDGVLLTWVEPVNEGSPS